MYDQELATQILTYFHLKPSFLPFPRLSVLRSTSDLSGYTLFPNSTLKWTLQL